MGNSNQPELNTPLTNNDKKTKNGFTSKIGFVLAAAGSAIGLGNLWRFPYLAAKYGGGIFVLCYIILAVTIGFALLVLEIGIGRKTGKSVIGAFPSLNKKFKWFGYICVIVPMIIVPYYCVIGGWVTKYIYAFIIGDAGIIGNVDATVSGNFFSSFISNPIEPLIFFLIYAGLGIVIVAFGVQKGIEKMSKILMPILAIMAIFLMIYVLCQPGAFEGVGYFLIPDFSKFSFATVLSALGQLFYSMSLAMCIMITYGSYMKKEDSIPSSARQISIFDTAFAIIAGLIIIPAIFAYSPDSSVALQKPGPSLMFIQLPVIFNTIPGGRIIGAIFFILVFFAALTSSISLIESIVAVLCENGKMKRVTACCIVFCIVLVLGALSSLGFGVLSGFSFQFQGEAKGILDFFDILANNVLMPIVAIITCVFAGWCIDKTIIPKEIGYDKSKLKTNYFNVMIRFVAPICILAILLSGLFLTF